MNFLQKLLQPVANLESLAGEAGKAINRATPWGQQNQNTYNQLHSLPQPLRGGFQVRPVQAQGQLGQPTIGSGILQNPNEWPGYNPGFIPLQTGHSYTQNIQPQLPYDQQQLQTGVQMHNLNYLANPSQGQVSPGLGAYIGAQFPQFRKL